MDIWKKRSVPNSMNDRLMEINHKKAKGLDMQHTNPKKRKAPLWLWLGLSGITITATLYANYQGAVMGNNYLSGLQNWLNSITIDGIIATLFSITMAGISAHFYNHKGRKYAKDKTEKIETPASFSYIYRYIQITTIVASIGSFLSNHPVFIELHNEVYLVYLGISIATIAIIFFVTAKFNLGEHYSPCFDSFVPKDIIREGLYKYVRHPIYTSNIILLIGMAIATGSIWIIINLVVLTAYYVNSAYREEAVLLKRFPRYEEYIRHSNMFLPFPKLNRRHA